MRRRRFLAIAAGSATALAGCRATPGSPETSTGSPTPTPGPEKPGSVDNHRITAVEALSHDAVRRTTDDGHEWVVTVTLRLEPQDTETATAYPVGVFFVFLDADGRKVYRAYEQVAANTGNTPRTVRVSAAFRPDEATADTFHRYRIDLVHG